VNASALEFAGLMLACGAAATAILAPDPRLRYAAAIAALVAAPALIAGDVWDQSRFEDLRDQPALLAGGACLALGGIAALAAGFTRWPAAFPVLALALLPFRVPISIGGDVSNLLLPLYGVIGGGLVAAAWAAWHGGRDGRPAMGGPGRWLLRLLAATLVLYAVQSAYSEDVSNAIENVGFFLVPFAILFVLLLEVAWRPRLLAIVLSALAASALLFAAVAFWEYAVRDLIFNHDLLEANQLHAYFRVNSLFHDPNVLGRYLVLTVIPLAAVIAWGAQRRVMLAAAAVSVISIAALVLTFSITSISALVAGLGLVAIFRWGLRAILPVGAALAIVAGGYLVLHGTDSGRGDITEGRVDLVSGGLELAGDRPVWGWGSGSFGAAFESRIKRAETTTSHTEPITVAAEQGGIGVVVYIALLAVAVAVFLRGARGSVARGAVAASFGALLVHTLGYAGFVTDPATWALLALGIALPVNGVTPAELD
jgi:O-antigen ligase/polysaccharide polymerase Wzy-like membrane protein